MAKSMTFAAFAVTSALMTSTGHAEGYPDRSITMVVPFAAGGPTDTVGRLIADKMSADLGQQIIVENIGGAGGTLGAGQVAAAEADGYTILLHHISWRPRPRYTAIWPTSRLKPLNMWVL